MVSTHGAIEKTPKIKNDDIKNQSNKINRFEYLSFLTCIFK